MTDLQQARQESADRLLGIGMAHVPEGYEVKFRRSLTGRHYAASKRIEAPRPVTRKSLYIFLHECAHAHLHSDGKKRPCHVKEMEAEQWAHAKMREHGVPVPKAMTERAKQYVAWKIQQARKRGAKRIDPAALRFAGIA
ncbi:hypothetical protein [Methylobacterium komagatae]